MHVKWPTDWDWSDRCGIGGAIFRVMEEWTDWRVHGACLVSVNVDVGVRITWAGLTGRLSTVSSPVVSSPSPISRRRCVTGRRPLVCRTRARALCRPHTGVANWPWKFRLKSSKNEPKVANLPCPPWRRRHQQPLQQRGTTPVRQLMLVYRKFKHWRNRHGRKSRGTGETRPPKFRR